MKIAKKIKNEIFKMSISHSFSRLRYSLIYKKEKFKLKTPNVFDTIFHENYWNSEESFSGTGSTMSSTENVRKILPILWEKYNIKTVLDVPCGDFNWMRIVDKSNIIYTGGDIVKEIVDINNQKYQEANVKFKVIDITKDNLPQVDMILCKDCLQHLSFDNIRKALINFKQSGAKYLLITSYPLTWRNWDIENGDYRPLNLRKKPFNLPEPMYKIHEIFSKYNEPDKYMFLYEIEKL